MLRIKNRTICKRICRKERGGSFRTTCLLLPPKKILLSPMGNSAKKRSLGKSCVSWKKQEVPLAFDAKKHVSEYWGRTRLLCWAQSLFNRNKISLMGHWCCCSQNLVGKGTGCRAPLSLLKKSFQKNPSFPTPDKENANKTWHLPV